MNRNYLFSIVTALAVSSAAFAAEEGDRIEVTGSRIKRTEVEGANPIQTIDRKDIERKGYSTLGEVVKDIGANSFGSTQPSSNAFSPGYADVNLRGLGSSSTLVLLNGQRIPTDAITGATDINLTPVAAVERVEILKSGASAIYGSDAIGGVMNIITRKDYKGTEFSITHNLPTTFDGGKSTNISLVNGFSTEKLSVATFINYRNNEAIYYSQRPWNENAWSTYSPTSNYRDIGTTNSKYVAGPNCQGPTQTDPDTGNTFCLYNNAPQSQDAPGVQMLGVLSNIQYELNSENRFNALISYTRRESDTVASPTPTQTNAGGTLVVPSYTPPTSLASFTNGNNMLLRFRTTGAGNRESKNTSNALSALVGLTHELPKDWSLDANASYSFSKSETQFHRGWILSDQFVTQLQNRTINPFTTGYQGDYGPSMAYPFSSNSSSMSGLEVMARGDAFSTSQGPVSVAVGALVNYADYKSDSDQNSLNQKVLGLAGKQGVGKRVSEALYGELVMPLIQKQLELTIASRFDHYSDFGSTLNPMMTLKYTPTTTWLFRASAGTGFHAPLLHQLYQGQSQGFTRVFDYVNEVPASIVINQFGNKALLPEKAVNVNLGSVFSPTPEFSLTTDWFFTTINGSPGVALDDLLRLEAAGVDVNTNGNRIYRGQTASSSNGLLAMDAPYQNLGATRTMGLDLTADYKFGRFQLVSEHTHTFYYRRETFPGTGLRDYIGTSGTPHWRNTTKLLFAPSQWHNFSLTSRFVPSQLMADEKNKTSDYWAFDFSYVLATKNWGSITLGLLNLTDARPPLDSDGDADGSLYDTNGRQLLIGYKKAF